jgi:membrane protein involved in colicin uptake
MSNEPEQRDTSNPSAATAAAPQQDELLDFVQVGGRITDILEAAKEAADDIRAQAQREADRVRAEAEDQAAAAVAEAARKADEMRRDSEQLRAEAARYSKETREAADSYATQNRRDADESAARVLAEAEERARKVGRDAARRAKQAEEAAQRRQAAILAQAGRFEDRLQNLLTVFRGMTGQLEELLAKGQEEATGEASPEETLQATLETPIKRRRSEPPPERSEAQSS